MDAYDRSNNLGKQNLADSVAIYGRGRKLFRTPTYIANYLFQSSPVLTKPKILQQQYPSQLQDNICNLPISVYINTNYTRLVTYTLTLKTPN